MKHFIPHRIFVINEQIEFSNMREIILRCYALAFEWANKMGLEGKRVYDLYLQKPDPINCNSMNTASYLWCKIECTEEERMQWEEQQKLNIIDNVLN